MNTYRTRRVLIGLAALLLALALVFGLLWHHRGAIAIWLAAQGQPALTLTEIDLPLRTVSLDSLTAREDVTLDQSLMLISPSHPLPADFVPSVAEYKTSGVMMNTCILDSYAALSAAVSEKMNDKLYVSSSLRTAEEQEALYKEDPTTAVPPGASEHQTGLALDVYVAYFAGDGFLDSAAGRFVNAHCHEYGFIIRYPSYGVEQTGVRFEPWHIRYVGQPHARVIMTNRLTFEEYLDSLSIDTCYTADGATVLRTLPDSEGFIRIPDIAGSIIISPDNLGGYIVTIHP